MSRPVSSLTPAMTTCMEKLTEMCNAMPLDQLNKYQLANLQELFASRMRAQMSANYRREQQGATTDIIAKPSAKGRGAFGATYTGD